MTSCESWKVNGASYKGRAYVLFDLGFNSYQEYLASDLWRTVRAKVYRNKGLLCSVCRSPATEVHHKAYTKRAMLGLSIKSMFPICRTCHKSVEFDECGRKKTVGQARAAFDKMIVHKLQVEHRQAKRLNAPTPPPTEAERAFGSQLG